MEVILQYFNFIIGPACAFICIGVFCYFLVTAFKKLSKKVFKKFYKSVVYEILKIFIAPIVGCVIGVFTPDEIFSIFQMSDFSITSKIWLGTFAGLSSSFCFFIFKSLAKRVKLQKSSEEVVNKNDEEQA